MSKQEKLQAAINQIRNAIPDLQGVLVASSDGLAISHALSTGVDAARLAAMAATALGLGRRISDTLGAGEMTEITVIGKEGQILIYSAGAKGVMAIVAPATANIGLIHLEARDIANQVAEIL